MHFFKISATEDEEDDNDEEEDVEDEDDDFSDDDGLQVSSLVSKMKDTDLNFPKETDFCELMEGMDDLGENEDEGETDAEVESEEDSEEQDDEDNDNNADNSGGVMTFSKEKVAEEVEKGKAVKNQLGM